MNNGLGLLIAAPLVVVTLTALMSCLRVLFPGRVANARSAAIELPGRSFALGAVNLLFLGVLVAAFGALGEGRSGIWQLLAVLVLGLLTVALAFGLTGMAILTGERLLPEASPTRQTAWGAAVLLLASLTPFLGWFVLFPYLAIHGLGGFLIGLFRRTPA